MIDNTNISDIKMVVPGFRPTGKNSIFRAIAEDLRRNIEKGRWRCGERLPSVTELRGLYNVSHVTVLRAIEELSNAGFVSTVSGSGTFVRFEKSPLSFKPRAEFAARPEMISDFARSLPDELSDNESESILRPANEQLPLARWKEAILRQIRIGQLPGDRMDLMGHDRLRTAVAGLLRRTRSVECLPEQVVIVSSLGAAFNLLFMAVTNPDDGVAFENPTHAIVRQGILQNGLQGLAVPVLNNGLALENLISQSKHKRIKAVVTTACQQEPLGISLSEDRRDELLGWATNANSIIIENDLNGELQFGRKPLPALKALDEDESVVYIGSFRKTLFPLVSYAYLVVPAWLTSAIEKSVGANQILLSQLEQRALAEIIEDGHLERHIRNLKEQYNFDRTLLIRSFTEHFSQSALVSHAAVGAPCVLVRFFDEMNECEFLRCGAAAGLTCISTKHYYLSKHPSGEYFVRYTGSGASSNSGREEAICQSVKTFRDLLQCN